MDVLAASERLVVRRFGRTRGVRGPGLRYLLPLADTGVRVPMGVRPHHLWIKATTRDGVPVRVRALAMVGTADPVRHASCGAWDVQASIEDVLRAVVADRDLADLSSLLADGDDADLARRVDEAIRPWGANASLVSVTDATVPVPADPPPHRRREGRREAAGRVGGGGRGAGRPR